MKINLKSGTPIYLQIVEQLKLSALYGRYQAGDRLPPVRELAIELRINPNTVAKAYRILKDEGIIDSRPGGGNFIAQQENNIAVQQKEDTLREELKAIITNAEALGVSKKRLTEIYNELFKEEKTKNERNSNINPG